MLPRLACLLLTLPFSLSAQQTTLPTNQPTEPHFISNLRQLTFGGKRAGEGYFSRDGKTLIFQSEREPDNPFYQIYQLNLESGDIKRISPGIGKTTCAWLHPDGKRALFSSTHEDPAAAAKQKTEIAERASGKEKRYAWDYDPAYELYETNLQDGSYKRLTNTLGYDAEGSYSPDGKWLVFSSNRHQFAKSTDAQKSLHLDPSQHLDIYIAKSDGSHPKRLTNTLGYDGGPFFSPDGSQICWRRFTEDGTRAEIYLMNADGAHQRPVTHLGAMSWAPYFHPSGEYLIFTTNLQGFANFELYVARADGSGTPVRVTSTDGFDGLPVFSPDGTTLSWTSNRNTDKASQIYLADWNDHAARTALGLTAPTTPTNTTSPTPQQFTADISETDIRLHVSWLASEKLRGRLTGTEGERIAADYLIANLESAGLKPGWKKKWRAPFSFTAGVALGPHNQLTIQGITTPLALDTDWRPLSFSETGKTAPAGVVFAGYGIEPPQQDSPHYTSYAHLNVKDKWVLMFRYTPENWDTDVSAKYSTSTSLRAKALCAREKGARGILIVSGPNSKVSQQLVPLSFDASLANSGITALSITDDLAETLLQSTGKSLQQWQDAWDKGESLSGVELDGIKISTSVDIHTEAHEGANVIGILPAPKTSHKLPPLIIGAHYDHLGDRTGPNSRAKDGEKSTIHYGADDNASGVAGMLELASWLSKEVREGRVTLKRDVIFAGWSGEEAGLLGSRDFVKNWTPAADDNTPLTHEFSAYVNMDMIGRMHQQLLLQGIGSSPLWKNLIEKANVPIGLPLHLQDDAYLPTDAMSFYLKKIPVLNFFTGSHAEYHTPRDTADTLNYPATTRIVKLAAAIIKDLATADTSPDFVEMPPPKSTQLNGSLRAYLGTIPDYAQTDLKGVKLSGVTALAPAAKAGLKAGDIIQTLAGRDIHNIYDYTQIISDLKIDKEVDIQILRGTKQLQLKITPKSRD